MKTEMIADTTAPETAIALPAAPKAQQTATITLHGHGATMQIVAERKADESARTYVITTDASKKSLRGLTEQHPNFEAAKTHTEKMAMKAEKLGWARRVATRGFVAKPDAFTALPAAPKAAKK